MRLVDGDQKKKNGAGRNILTSFEDELGLQKLDPFLIMQLNMVLC